ncbi:MAG: hypothetical protein K2J51_08525 [Alistipes sp.]|nr:hypothetical protein [Alistipes sp.]MDE6858322.1 hypothetical protein [Alistipes sp.]
MHDERIIDSIERLYGGGLPQGALRRMASLGLLDIRACERRVIAGEVSEEVRGGATKARAMENAAERHACSFEKVRAIVYRR